MELNKFRVKEMAGDSIVIEGWANKSVVDRGMDIIKKEAWMLDNFKKNPIMLFNHDTGKVVGKVIKCEAQDEGLFVKCQMSKSKDPMVQYVKDLVKEGILNSFSVGFSAHDEQKSAGANEITKAELYEVSIVSIPMNQESIFSVTTKSFEGKTYREAKRQVLIEKGATFASQCQDKIYEMEKEEGFDKQALVKELCEKMGCDEEELGKILAGEKEPSEEQMKAMNEVLKLIDEEKPEEHKQEEKATTVVAIKIPKSSVENIEAASTWAEENGWKGGMIEEEGEFFVAYQEDPELFEDLQEVEVGDGVMSVIGVSKKPAEEKQKQAVGGTEVQKFDDNAYLLQARQTNVLLSMLVDKMETLIMHMQAMVKPVEKPVVIEDESASAEQAEELMKWAEDLDKRIKMLGQ